ncbi:MAG TPA: hypothetical protein DC058_06185, partial [Planctomycetaceae bacterium]|nr:hypothetical protein [Planctomycetaceae bacterium]
MIPPRALRSADCHCQEPHRVCTGIHSIVSRFLRHNVLVRPTVRAFRTSRCRPAFAPSHNSNEFSRIPTPMTAQLIDGKQIAEQCRQQVRQQADAMLQQTGITPHLAAILCGDDPASQVYVRNKEKACATAGFRSTLHRLPADVTQPQLLQLIAALNSNPDVHGILVQLPLPRHL